MTMYHEPTHNKWSSQLDGRGDIRDLTGTHQAKLKHDKVKLMNNLLYGNRERRSHHHRVKNDLQQVSIPHNELSQHHEQTVDWRWEEEHHQADLISEG